MNEFVPFSAPDIGSAEFEAVANALRSGWITTGPEAAAFEREFASAVGGQVEAVAVNSATAGLHLALEALGVKAGDEVVVPTWTFTASAEVIRYLGATPVLVDVDPSTLNIDLAKLDEAITDRTRAVIVVHFAGLSVDMEALRGIIGTRQIKVLEDAAHAFPSSSSGVLVGSTRFSDATVFSFYANKTMTTGEGGMVTTADPQIAARIKVMRLHGIDRDVFGRYQEKLATWSYDVVAPGYKYNLTDGAAAMGRVQLRRAHDMRARRQQLAERYSDELVGLPVQLPTMGDDNSMHAWHLYVVRINDDAPVGRDEFIQHLASEGIGSSVHFIPLHKLTIWRDSLGVLESSFPVATREFSRVVSLPLFSKMSDDQASRVLGAVRRVLTR